MKISVAIPNYNKEEYVLTAIESCLNQTYKNIEILVFDNESTDSSAKIIEKFKRENKLNFLFATVPNIYAHCWDECVDEAKKILTGEYFTVLGSDDIFSLDYIENCVKFIEEKKCKVFQSPIAWFKDSKIINIVNHEYTDINDLKSKLINGCCINSPSVFYKTEIFKNSIFQTNPLKYSGAADYDLYCQLVDKNIFIENSCNFLGYYYRINNTQATWQMHKAKINYDKLIQKKWKEKWKI